MLRLELIVDEGRTANAARFFQLGSDLLELLDEISDVPVAWRIDDLRLGSAVARVAPPADAAHDEKWLRRAVRSLHAVQGGAAADPDWSPDAIRTAHRFVEHGLPTDPAEDWVPPKLILLDGGMAKESVQLTSELGSRLADLQPFERRMPGSVRGRLVGMNVSRGNRASLRLPSGRIVRLGFEASLVPDFKEAMLNEVEVIGDMRQDGDGRVFQARVRELRILEKPAASWLSVFGMDPDFTGQMSTSEFLEARHGEA